MMLYPLPKEEIAASAPMRFAPLNPLLFSPKCKTKRIRVQNAHRNDSQVIEKARWRSGDAADCKSAVSPQKSSAICTIQRLFASCISVGFGAPVQNEIAPAPAMLGGA